MKIGRTPLFLMNLDGKEEDVVFDEGPVRSVHFFEKFLIEFV